MALLKIKTTVSVISDHNTEDDYPDGDYVLEDILEDYRATALEAIAEAINEDIAHITTEVVTNGS